MAISNTATEKPLPDSIGGRYRVLSLLGRGGMASVYRVTDQQSGRSLALKRMDAPSGSDAVEEAAALFEREFRILAELSHPRIIDVYEYGVADAPYYTMELLEGQDLREMSPLPWRQACVLIYDVCSSLALLHSRRLVHRDVSPRNIRCTADGHAKLLDFGTMGPMGSSDLIVGTPSYVAPEVVYASTLDARTDLYSLGATLYRTLTGRSPYPASSFAELFEVWKSIPPPPSSLVPGIPPAVDDLVLSLIRLEPGMRPRGAFDVMQRLAAMTRVEPIEPPSVRKAYLSTPIMVGREEPIAALRRRMADAFEGRTKCVVIEGAAGLGRSRMLDATAIEAKTLGATVLRAAAGAAKARGLAAIQTLATQAVRALPGAARAAAAAASSNSTVPGIAEPGAQAAYTKWLLALSKEHPLVIAVDDAERLDAASTACLATLVVQAEGNELAVVLTAESGASSQDPTAYSLLTRNAERIVLAPLTESDTNELVGSLFGDVPNLGLVCRSIHSVAAGNPRACMDLAQHLADRGTLVYDRGIWSLPSRIDAADLPSSAEEAMRARILALSTPARRLVEAQALASHDSFTRDDYALLWSAVGDDGRTCDPVLSELLAQQILVTDGARHRLAHRGWAAQLLSALSDEERMERHRSLVPLYERRLEPATVRHLLEAGAIDRGLDLLKELLAAARESANLYGGYATPAEVATMLELAERHALSAGRGPREINEIRRWLVTVSVSADDAVYWRAAPRWLSQLERDSGLAFHRELSEVTDPKERLTRSLALAKERFQATPEDQRVYRPDEAIRLLSHYVVMSIAVGSRSLDARLIDSLPAVLEPFAPLSPVTAAILENARATREARYLCQPERARLRWMDVLERLKGVSAAELPFVDALRAACVAGVCAMEALMGLASATAWGERLGETPAQAVNALYLRKAVRLQQGDWEDADRLRRRAELESLSARSRQMFTNSIPVELAAHVMANDLTGLRQVMDRIEILAGTSEGWRVYRELAEAHFQRIRGNLEAARQGFEASRRRSGASPKPSHASTP